MTDWACDRLGLAFIPRPAMAQRHIESFNSRVRKECRSINIFWSLAPEGLGVAGCFLDELHAGGQAELGVDVGEVGLHGAG